MTGYLLRTSLFSLCLVPVLSFAQLVTSIGDGLLLDPTTWDCSCIPDSRHSLLVKHDVTSFLTARVDNITVASTGHFTHGGLGTLTVGGNLVLKAGGEFTNHQQVDVWGNYEVGGKHSGTKETWLRGRNTELRGFAGADITNTAALNLSDGDKIIPADSRIIKPQGAINIRGIKVSNYGSFQGLKLKGTAGSTWEQMTNSILTVSNSINSILRFFADAKGNTVVYDGVSASTQQVVVPQGGKYFRLELIGGSLGSEKTLLGNVEVLQDLRIENCMFNARNGGTSSDLMLRGNWDNISGSFEPGSGKVEFSSAGPVHIISSGTEHFNDLTIGGSSPVELLADLDVQGNFRINSAITVGVGSDVRFEGDLDVIGILTAGTSHFTAAGVKNQRITGEIELVDLSIAKSGGSVSINGGLTAISGTLELTGGTLQANGRLLMRSNSEGDSRIAEVTGGAITGKLSTQRFIDAGATNWRFLTSPVQNVTLADWKDDFVMSGFPGSHHPGHSFTNIFGHDETMPGTLDDGFIPASDISDPLEKGVGYWVWCGDNSAGTQEFTIDVTGEAYTGDITLPVTYSSFGSPDDDGWNMVGNPYVSVIDWDSPNWVKSNMNNAVSIWNPDLQQFSTYIDGVSVNGGSRYIASSQAFWVHANGPSPQLTIKESAKTSIVAGFKSAGPNNVLRLMVTGQGFSDQAVMRLDPGSTLNFDPSLDALEMISLNQNAPNIYTQTRDGEDVQVNTFPAFASDTSMFISVEVGVADTYVLSVEEVSTDFKASCLIIEDLLTNVTTTLVEGGTMQFFADPADNGQRFLLYMSAPLHVDVVDVTCAGDENGSLVVTPSGQGPWDIDVINAGGNVVGSAEQANASVSFSGLEAGLYDIVVTGQAPCGSVTVQATIAQPAPIEVLATVNNTTCAHDNDGSIALNVSGGQAPYQFLWNDGSAAPNLDNIGGGTYSVQVTDSALCGVQHSIQVEAEHQVQAMFHAPETAAAGEVVNFLDLSVGADQVVWDMGDGTAPFVANNPSHTYAQPGVYTIQQNAIAAGCGDIHLRHISVDGFVGVDEQTSMQSVQVVQLGDEIMVSNLSGTEKELSVHVMNVLGQTLQPVSSSRFGTGNTRLDLVSTANTMLLITLTDEMTGVRITKKILR